MFLIFNFSDIKFATKPPKPLSGSQKLWSILIEKNKERGEILQEQKAGVVVDTISAKISDVDLIILSVKPQDYPAVASDLQSYIKKSQVVLSIMAGIPMPATPPPLTARPSLLWAAISITENHLPC